MARLVVRQTDYGTTIPFRSEQIAGWRAPLRRAYLIARFPPLFFALAPLALWWGLYLKRGSLMVYLRLAANAVRPLARARRHGESSSRPSL